VDAWAATRRDTPSKPESCQQVPEGDRQTSDVRQQLGKTPLGRRQKPPLTCGGACAPGRIRTCDTGFRRAVLYPLSYEGGGTSSNTCLELTD